MSIQEAKGINLARIVSKSKSDTNEYIPFFNIQSKIVKKNPRKIIREIRKNSYTERGRPVEIHQFLTRAKELFLGNLDNL